MKIRENFMVMDRVEYSKLHKGQYGWQIECHDSGKMWFESLSVPSEWGLIKEEVLIPGCPRSMGDYRLVFAHPDEVKKLRRRFEDFLRKTSSETLWDIVGASYQAGGPALPIIYDMEDEDY